MQDKSKNSFINWYLGVTSTGIFCMCVWIITAVLDLREGHVSHAEKIVSIEQKNAEQDRKNEQQDDRIIDLANRFFVRP